MSNRGSEIRPFRVEIPQQALDDLRDRLDRVRWTTEVPGQAPEGKLQWFMDHKISFNQLHAQQPQTLAHALADSC